MHAYILCNIHSKTATSLVVIIQYRVYINDDANNPKSLKRKRKLKYKLHVITFLDFVKPFPPKNI